jgi:hypothetical protein
VRDDIGERIGKRYAPLVALLGKHRAKIKRLSPESKKTFWDKVLVLVKTSNSNEDIVLGKLESVLANAQGGRP